MTFPKFISHRGAVKGTVLLVVLGCACAGVHAQSSDQDIYTDALSNGWENWSWANVNFNNATPVHAGSKSTSVTAKAWEALYFHHSPFDSASFTNLSFWIHGGSVGGQRLLVQAVLGGTSVSSGQPLAPLAANAWQQINIPMTALAPQGQARIDGVWIQDRTGTAQQTFYVDDVRLQTTPATVPTSGATVVIRIDARANRKPIKPEIYGVAFATTEQLKELNAPLNRSGGNATTRYNWQANASNHASDWYFESLPSTSSASGADGDDFIRDSLSGGAQAMLTIPVIGWVAKLGPNRGRLSSYSIAKYGPQTDRDSQWYPDAGNGVSSGTGLAITNNNPDDANLPVGTDFQMGWIQHLTNRWRSAVSGGLRYYILDNEWSLWHETHRDVHPIGATMDEVRDRFIEYATMIKGVDPNALVVGPEEWGWSGYLYSGYDLQWGGKQGWSSLPDRNAHGGIDFLPWFLTQARQRSEALGRRLLDVFTVHYYPQGGEFSDDVSTPAQLRRNRSTRSLWDPSYVDESWINERVRLVPRLKQWVSQNYPGTPIGITEYSWGAESHINGATAQADVLGIFGREGLDLATRWTVPATGTPTFKAIQMYRNYDGQKSTFGETSVSSVAPNPDDQSAFASVRTSDGALTVMVVNKVLSGSTPVSLSISNFSGIGKAEVWQLTSANKIIRQPDIDYVGGSLNNVVPAQSITLYVLPLGMTAPRLRAGAYNAATNEIEFWLDGQAGRRYVLQSSIDLLNWTPVSTNTLSADSFRFHVSVRNSRGFYRTIAYAE